MLSRFDPLDLAIRGIAVALIVLSASLHEFGHAYAAYRCGDSTAKERGRLTINPLAHIDPFGSVVLPLILMLSGMGYMAYAKPVPYNPYRLRNPQRDELIVAFAGPAANILQAAVAAIVYRLGLSLVYGVDMPMYLSYVPGSPLAWLFLVLQLYIQVNCSLALFNLLPIPPLDGSSILSFFFRGEKRSLYYHIQRYALPITLVLIWILPEFTGIDPVGWWLDGTAGRLETFLLGW